MNAAVGQLLTSNVGLKVLMAVTGSIYVGFVFVHMVGNLLVFAGDGGQALNDYGHFLQEGTHGAIWAFRLVMLAAIGGHIYAAVATSRNASAARPVGYAAGRKSQAANWASLTMRYGGLTLLLFILFHLAHFTLGVVQPELFTYGDVYGNLVRAFQQPGLVALYVVAMVALGLHLYHGIFSGLQTLGVAPHLDSVRRGIAGGYALTVVLGNISIPTFILLEVVK